jgi:hypothetical protein
VGQFPSPDKKLLAPVVAQLEPVIPSFLDTELESQLFLEAVPPSLLFQNPKEPEGRRLEGTA